MPRTEFIATGFHVPARVVTNDDLARLMDTSDEWIMQRSGIKTRYWVSDGETGVTLAREAACKALTKAGLQPRDLDCIVYCTCTPDHFEPGNGVFLQRELGVSDIPAIDVRNQCSGFLYGLSVADAWIRTGTYRRVLLVGAEVHSRGLDKTTRGRDTAVLFGDGAGAARSEWPHHRNGPEGGRAAARPGLRQYRPVRQYHGGLHSHRPRRGARGRAARPRRSAHPHRVRLGVHLGQRGHPLVTGPRCWRST